MRFRRFLILSPLVVLILFAGVALAGSGGFDLTWHSINDGGAHMTGSSYVLEGSIVRSPAGISSAGSYSLTGGFQAGFLDNTSRVFLPSMLK